MGARRERRIFLKFIERSIANRHEWARSEEGYRVLGPGSPTIPGMQDLCAIRDWLMARERVARNKKEKD